MTRKTPLRRTMMSSGEIFLTLARTFTVLTILSFNVAIFTTFVLVRHQDKRYEKLQRLILMIEAKADSTL